MRFQETDPMRRTRIASLVASFVLLLVAVADQDTIATATFAYD